MHNDEVAPAPPSLVAEVLEAMAPRSEASKSSSRSRSSSKGSCGNNFGNHYNRDYRRRSESRRKRWKPLQKQPERSKAGIDRSPSLEKHRKRSRSRKRCGAAETFRTPKLVAYKSPGVLGQMVPPKSWPKMLTLAPKSGQGTRNIGTRTFF